MKNFINSTVRDFKMLAAMVIGVVGFAVALPFGMVYKAGRSLIYVSNDIMNSVTEHADPEKLMAEITDA